MREGYSVTVSKWGEPILTIEPNMLSGADLSDEDQAAIDDLGHHLVAFSGLNSERFVKGIRHSPPTTNEHRLSCECPDCTPF